LRGLIAAVAALSLLGLAPGVPSLGGTAVTAAAAVQITLKCYSNPERTTIANKTNKKITVKTFGSTYKPYGYEPFRLNKSLAAGKSITYQTGYAAKKNELTRNYIYNDNGRDGAKVVTSVGTFKKHC
jgi:phosphate-selective porin